MTAATVPVLELVDHDGDPQNPIDVRRRARLDAAPLHFRDPLASDHCTS